MIVLAIAIPGGAFLTAALNLISQSLLIPVVIILLIFVIFVIISLGGLIFEYSSRTKVSVNDVSNLILDISNCDSIETVKSTIQNANITNTQKGILLKITDTGHMSSASREAYARKLVENEEEVTDKSLRITDIITRIGPTLGLMGTLIPLGTGLAALGSGDINTLSTALIVAFDTTVVGIGCGALAYVISKIRYGWYDEYLSNLDVLSDAVLDFMNINC